MRSTVANVARPPRWLTGPWPAVLLGGVCFLNSLGNGFAYDDYPIVVANPRITAPWAAEIWLTDWWYERTDSDYGGASIYRDRLYRPLTLFSFALNYATGGLDPFGYHLVNVILHMLMCGLLWRLALALLDDRVLAAISAALFAVHPVHCEAVANIVGRAEVLAAVFLALGMLGLLGSRVPPAWRVAVAAAAFLGALLAKETAVCYPLLALLAIQWRHGWRALLTWPWAWRTAVLLAPLLIYFPLRLLALEGHLLRVADPGPELNPLFIADLPGRLIGPLTILGYYARLLIVPSRLSSDYGLGVISPYGDVSSETVLGVVAAVALLACLAGFRSQRRELRLVATLSAMTLASYVLISNTGLLIGVSLAERLMYWPSAPALMLLALAVHSAWRRLSAPGAALARLAPFFRTLGVLVIVAMGLRTAARNMDWADNTTLFLTDYQTFPSSFQLSLNRAHMLMDLAITEGDAEERARLLDLAVETLKHMRLRYAESSAVTRDMGKAYLLKGDLRAARENIELSRQLFARDHRTILLLSALERAEGTGIEEALEAAQARADAAPDDAAAQLELGRLLIDTGRHFRARQVLELANQLDPDNAAILQLLGQARTLAEDEPAAIEALRAAVRLNPADWQSHTNLVRLLAERDNAAALAHAEIALRLRPRDARVRLNYAEALYLVGRRREGIAELHRLERDLPEGHALLEPVRERIRLIDRRR